MVAGDRKKKKKKRRPYGRRWAQDGSTGNSVAMPALKVSKIQKVGKNRETSCG